MQTVSIIIPIYNVENYLRKCIESVIYQTYTNIEIILVDDGSQDACPQICDEYEKKDARIRVIHQNNGGRSRARNVGIRNATGEYLMFVDGDDWIDNNCIEELYKLAISESAQLIVGRYRQVFSDSVQDGSTGEMLVLQGQEPLEFYVRGYANYQNANSVCVKLYKRELVEGIYFEEGKYFEDVMFVTKIYAKCTKCIYYDQALYNYNIATPTSITFAGVNELTFRDEIPCFNEKEQFLLSLGRKDLSDTYSFFKNQRLLSYYIDCYVAGTKENIQFAKRIRRIIKSEQNKIHNLCKKREGVMLERLGISMFLYSGWLYRCFFSMIKIYGKWRKRITCR